MVENLAHISTYETADVSCVKCHQTVVHGEPVGLGGPLRPEEKGGI